MAYWLVCDFGIEGLDSNSCLSHADCTPLDDVLYIYVCVPFHPGVHNDIICVVNLQQGGIHSGSISMYKHLQYDKLVPQKMISPTIMVSKVQQWTRN